MEVIAREHLAELSDDTQRIAGARSRLCGLLLSAIDYPDEALCQELALGHLSTALRDGFDVLGISVDASDPRWDDLDRPGSADELAIEYTRLFDMGASGPPCALYGGLYGGARMKVMEEAVRFYNHFGLTLSESRRELPDHIATQLEFLHYLAYREAEALTLGIDPGPYRRAQRDFIQRHPGSWIPQLVERLRAQQAAPYFRALFELVAEFLACEGRRLSCEAPPDQES